MTIAEVDRARLACLTQAEAAGRLVADGPNELPAARRRSLLAIAWEVVREPMFLLLVACGAIYLLLGDLEEALMLLGFVLVVMGITLYQQRKTERALEALRDLSSPRALVLRDGHEVRIAGREVVRGDILILNEGDRVAADGVLLTGRSLSVDESLLTGESVPVRKAPGPDPWAGDSTGGAAAPPAPAAAGARRAADRVLAALDADRPRPGGDDQPFVYSGTLIVRGRGMARVRETGAATEIGRIGKALQRVESEDSRLQQETAGLVRRLAMLGLGLCALVIVVYGLTRGDWLKGFLAGITLAMATLPEEYPVVLTVFLALGAWRLSQKQVLTRRPAAVETLGSATVLCTDKTGTLTLNRMSVARLCTDGQFLELDGAGPDGRAAGPADYLEEIGPGEDHEDTELPELPETFHALLEFSVLASQRDPFDPMEKAIIEMGQAHLARTEHLHHDWTLVQEYPLSPELLALSHVWQSPDGADYVIATKGAPEAIADLCHLTPGRAAEVKEHVTGMAADGLRVLGVARARFRRPQLPPEQHDFEFELLGLIGLADPVRPAVPRAIQECREAGVRVVMITGDYPVTAQNIGRQIGLPQPAETITGPELDRMDDAELRRRIGTVSIFARAVPEQKLRLVEALKANGEIVAMTGDGVNDAPALKAAHIGIAMGGRGTDVARESSSLVLLDDDFSSIVRGIRMGRRIFDNIQKAVAYILAIHVPIAGMSLLPVLFQWPLVLLPVHILFLELIIDPACSTVFEAEPEEADVMRRPPRSASKPLFSRRVVTLGLLQGVGVLLVVLGLFILTMWQGRGEREARTLAYTALIVANLALILVNRSWSRSILVTLRTPNRALWWVMGGAVTFLALALYLPGLRRIFQFDLLHPGDALLCLAVGTVSILWFELLKLWGAARKRRSSPRPV